MNCTEITKAKTFGKVLEKVFAEDHKNSLSKELHAFIENYIKANEDHIFTTLESIKQYDNEFNMDDIKRGIKTLRINSAPGSNKIRNAHLFHLPDSGLRILQRIANLSWNDREVLDEWKLAEITMI